MAVIEVTFDPLKWTWAGAKGAWSTYADKDGTTGWAFEAFGGGFARFNLSDGSIIVQDSLFGPPDRTGGGTNWFIDWYPSCFQTFFTQDPNDHTSYFMTAQGVASGGSTNLYKFHIASGPVGNLLNGYCVVDGVFDLAANWSSPWLAFDGMSSCVWHNPSTNKTYFAIQNYNVNGFSSNQSGMFVVDTSTMSLVGKFQIPVTSPNSKGFGVFADNNNILWAAFSDENGNVTLVSWNPTDGVTGSTLNTNSHSVPQTTSGILPTGPDGNHWMTFIDYLPQSNSVLITDTGIPPASPGAGNLSLISLSTFTRTAFAADTTLISQTAGGGSFPASPVIATSVAEVGSSNTNFVLQGGAALGGNQVGGIVKLINPSTLAVNQTANITALINASAVADPIALANVSNSAGGAAGAPQQYPPFTGLSYNPTLSKVIVTYGDLSSGLGSPVYIVDVPSGPTPATPVQVVGGQFVDSLGNPLANGYLLFKLQTDGVVNTNTQVCAGYTIKIPLDSNGFIVTSPAYSLWPNNVLTPSGTFYLVSAFTSQGQLVWGPNAQSILSSPSPFDVGAWLPGKIS